MTDTAENPSITPPQLTKLNILLTEADLADRDDALAWDFRRARDRHL